jgi:hypothetical protein
LKHLGDCHIFVTCLSPKLIHENETKSRFERENLRADNPTLSKGTTFDSQ